MPFARSVTGCPTCDALAKGRSEGLQLMVPGDGLEVTHLATKGDEVDTQGGWRPSHRSAEEGPLRVLESLMGASAGMMGVSPLAMSASFRRCRQSGGFTEIVRRSWKDEEKRSMRLAQRRHAQPGKRGAVADRNRAEGKEGGKEREKELRCNRLAVGTQCMPKCAHAWTPITSLLACRKSASSSTSTRKWRACLRATCARRSQTDVSQARELENVQTV